MMETVLILIMLHGIDGREVDVNVDEITSLQCKMPGAENKAFHENVNAIVYLTDGKFVSVTETCTTIRDLIKRGKEG